jgi:predicted  nucleic acid-binding Zn-ribbon protein
MKITLSRALYDALQDRQLNASSELDQLRQENELLKIENEQLKQQIEQMKKTTGKPTDRIDTLEEIIEERDDDIDTLKKEIGGAPSLAPHVVLTPDTLTHW